MTRSFRDILGINAGKEWDQLYNNNNTYGYNPLKNIFRHVRSFHLMEDDYPKGEFPGTGVPDVKLPSTPDRKWGRMNNYKLRYQRWKEDFESIRVSLTSIAEYSKAGGLVRMRRFPSKWYSKAQWGGTSTAIKANAKTYALAFAKLYAPALRRDPSLIELVEIGNEPWGDVGVEGYQAIAEGIIEAFQEYYGDQPRLQLSSAAFQAHAPKHVWKAKNCDYPSGDYVAKMLSKNIYASLDELNTHPYSFTIGTVQLKEPPESRQSDFQHVRSMFDYRKRMGRSDMQISATEYGWDSRTVGEAAQGIYILRNTLLMARMGFHRLYVYEGFDNPGLKGSLYDSSGIFTARNNQRAIGQPKQAYRILLQFMQLLGDTHYQSCLSEDDTYIYTLGREPDRPTHLIAWRATEISKTGNPDLPEAIERPNFLRKNNWKLRPQFHKLNGAISLNDDLRFKAHGHTYATAEYVQARDHRLRLRLSPIPYVFEIEN